MNTITIAKAIRKHKIDIITHPGARIPVDTSYVAVKLQRQELHLKLILIAVP